MEAVTVWVLSVTAELAVVLALAVTLAWRASMRRTSSEIAELRDQIEALAGRAATQALSQDQRPEPVMAEFIITDMGSEEPPPVEVTNSVVLSATIGEPLVKAAAFAHGLRRALTPENRNRIRFEMKRELRRSRKARRSAQREAGRNAREQVAS